MKKRKRDGDKDGGTSSKKNRTKRSSSASTKDARIVHVAHILQKHVDSRNPYVSWKDRLPVKRTKVEARERLEGFLKQLKNIGEKKNKEEEEEEENTSMNRFRLFCKIASTESDCSSARNGGVMKPFGRGKMQRNFEEAAFGLKTDELSEIADTQSGLHIIYCIEGPHERENEGDE